MRDRSVAWVGWALLLSGAAAGQGRAQLPAVVLAGESRTTATRLAEAGKQAQAKKWADAVAQLQGILDGAGDDLVPLDAGRSVQARRLCHARLAAMPAEGLKLYRARAEPRARKWLEEGAASRDAGLLARVVDEAFCTVSAAKALDLLGDLAFERGRFAEAEGWWRLLAPLRPNADEDADAADLAYPDPGREVAARARAKQLLARLYAGAPGWGADLKAYRAKHKADAGTLAGRKGAYADLLQALADARKKEPPADDPDWTTFGGDADRGRVVAAAPGLPGRLSQLCRGGPTWRFDLRWRSPQKGELKPVPATATAHARSLAFHPVVAGDHVLVADARYVTAYDLRAGKAEDWYDAAKAHAGVKPNLDLPAEPDLRYTLTVADGCVFARLGAQAVRDVRPPEGDKPGARPPDDGDSLLVCLALDPGKGGRLRWTAKAIDPARKDFSVFEGAPVAGDGRVYVAATRFEGDRVVTAVRCYAADAEGDEPPLLWRADVCETRELAPARGGAGGRRPRHHLLTLAGGRVVYCSHSGAVVALDARTGRRAWGVRYPRRDPREPEDEPRLHDLAPCLFADGRLYAAPSDSDYLLCLDSTTGETLWRRRGLDAVHLLGVGQGRLIFTTHRDSGPGRRAGGGLRAVGAAEGDDETGWSLPDDGGGLAPLGRGLLVGDLVLWPTDRQPYGVFAVRQRDGRQVDNPTLLHQIPAGNLVYAGGCLVVAGRRTLSVFVPPGRRLDEAEEEAKAEPTSARARLALARAQADRGVLDGAVKSASEAESLAGGLPAGHTRTALLRDAERERRDFLLASARAAGAAGRWEDADAALGRLARKGESPRVRLAALAEAAQLALARDEPARAVEAWQAVLAEEGLRLLPIESSAGRRGFEDSAPATPHPPDSDSPTILPQPAGVVAARAIAAILRAHGTKPYAAVEKRAAALWDEADDGDRAGVTGRLAAEFPHAAVTAKALTWLARREQKAGRPGVAARAWRRLLARPAGRDAGAEALIGLARAYEDLGCWQAARGVWERLARDHGGERRRDLDPKALMRDFVAARLRGPQFTAPAADALPDTSLPLWRRWQVDLGAGEEVLPADAAASGWVAAGERLWTAAGTELVCRDGGKVAWRSRLPFAPSWVGVHLDLVLVGGPGGVAGLAREDGAALWTFLAPVAPRHPTGQDHSSPIRIVLDPAPPQPLGGFRLAGGRVLCVQGGRALLALDAETGALAWRREAPGAAFAMPAPRGRIHPSFHADARTAVVQASGRLWLLDVPTGKLLHDAPTALAPWPRRPLPLGAALVGLVHDEGRVQALDPRTGKVAWAYVPPGKTTRSGEPPLLLARGGAVVVVEPLNIGYRLQRLSPATGKPLWEAPPLLDLPSLDGAAWALDGDAVYYSTREKVAARALADGKALWERPLTGGGHLLRLRGGLLAFPGGAGEARFGFRWPGGSVQWRKGPFPARGDSIAVACLDPASGRVDQRLNFVAGPPRGRWLAGEEGIPLPTLALRAGPTLGAGPELCPTRSGLLVAFGGRAWGLGADGVSKGSK